MDTLRTHHEGLPGRSKVSLLREWDGVTMKRVVIGMTESDCHTVSLYMFKLYLEERGFQVLNLGACVPLELMFREAVNFRADAIVIGAQNGHAVDDLKRLKAIKKGYRDSPPIFIGGRLAVGVQKPERAEAIIRGLGVDHVLNSFEEFLSIAAAPGDRRRSEMAPAAAGPKSHPVAPALVG